MFNVQTATKRNHAILKQSMQIQFNSASLNGDLREQEPMSRHTSWKTGGKADYFYSASDIDDLSLFLSGLSGDVPVMWVGFGSNLLVRDGGLSGVVISVAAALDRLEYSAPATITVGAGTACAKTARFAAGHGLAGIEFLAGIPGTIGGALAMNAGACGGEIWDVVHRVETVTRSGERKTHSSETFNAGYRSVSLPGNEWFVCATLKLAVANKSDVENKIRKMLSDRAETQPLGQHSCGSVFRNPPSDHAARLIEASGLKGKRIGGAWVSDKHANFIINSGAATAADIEQLIAHIKSTVYQRHNVTLVPEVRIVGNALPTETGGEP